MLLIYCASVYAYLYIACGNHILPMTFNFIELVNQDAFLLIIHY